MKFTTVFGFELMVVGSRIDILANRYYNDNDKQKKIEISISSILRVPYLN